MLMSFYNKKFVIGFDPRKPTDELMEALALSKTNGTSRLNPATRNKRLIDLNIEQLEFLAFEYKNSSALQKVLSQLCWFVKANEQLEKLFITDDELNGMFKEHFGFGYLTDDAMVPIIEVATQPVENEPTITDVDDDFKIKKLDDDEKKFLCDCNNIIVVGSKTKVKCDECNQKWLIEESSKDHF